MVMFTAGEPEVGKTTALGNIDTISGVRDKAKIIYDTDMSTYGSAKQKIDQALQTGHQVSIIYVNRDSIDSLVNGTLPKAIKTGRTVPITEHLIPHVGSLATTKQLSTTYKDNPNVVIRVIDNTHGRGSAREAGIDSLNNISYSKAELQTKLQSALEDAKNNGKISEATYQGTKGNKE